MAKQQLTNYVFTPGVAGVGNIKVLDKVQLNKILLITNVTDNVILYNFSDPTKQITVSFSDQYDADFPYANSASNGITVITFLTDTSAFSSTDSIQIFVESSEVKFRPYDVGTDAIERTRVATPQSMLDADFEYGIQPTKWMTIDQLRGYPSTFEIPGSDISISAVVTDASSPANGIGLSLITVTTAETHGLSSGTPFRIVGLLESVRGSSRAEGTFVVSTVLTSNIFQYIAKGKVGDIQGDSLYATYTQLRRGGFYTGASIGNPTFSLLSNGSTGTFSSKLITRTGANRIAYTGANTANNGSPLTFGNLVTGTQVTGITTLTTTTTFSQPVTSATNVIEVTNATDIEVGSAIDDGTGTSTFVNGITGTTLVLSNPYTAVAIGASSNIGIRTASSLNFGAGSGAKFTINRFAGRYVPTISNAGIGYTGGDRVVALGSSLGGSNVTNDFRIHVREINASGGIVSFTTNKFFAPIGQAALSQAQTKFGTASLLCNPTAGDVDSILTQLDLDFQFGTGDFTVEFFVYRNRTGESELLVDMRTTLSDKAVCIGIDGGGTLSYTFEGSAVINGSSTLASGVWYHVAVSRDSGVTRLYLDGSQEGSNFADTNDYGVKRVRIGANYLNEVGAYAYFDEFRITKGHSRYPSGPAGQVLVQNGAISGTVLTSSGLYPDLVGTTVSGGGITAGTKVVNFISSTQVEVDVTQTVATTSITFTASTSFTVPTIPFDTDIFTASLVHFDGVSGDTEFPDVSYGSAILSSANYNSISGVSTGSGFGAVFDIVRVGGSTTTYTVNPPAIGGAGAGSNYSVSDTIVIDGSVLGGVSSTNDVTITVAGVDGGTGSISSFTYTGLASSGNATYTNIGVLNSGSNATFDITKSGSSYSATIVEKGSGYYPNYQLKILGSSLGGVTPNNDLVMTVTDIDLSTSIVGTLSSITVAGSASVGTAITFFPSVSISEPTIGFIADSSNISYGSLARIQATFGNNHGLVPGNTIISTITSTGTGHSLASGPVIVDNIPNLNQVVYSAKSPGTITGAGLAGTIYPRPDCFYVHRPFDGGVQLGTGGPSHGTSAVRQSKKYIRYQSGKGIMYTTGALFAPSYDLRNVTSSGTTIGSMITCTTDDTEHGLQVGAEVQLSNITSAGYDGHYTVNSIINENVFTVLSTTPLSTVTPELGRPPSVSLYKWKGATVRAGAFDDQNGIFWQYDGINLSVGYRSSTFQLAGSISASPDSNNVTGTNTRFVDQLVIGDRIVIRGMSHIVTSIFNNTSITVNPDYRGSTSISGARAALTQDFIYPQNQWNLDRADGSGSSGYEIKINKMQMIGFQYSWYGAGFIDWMLRGPNGNYLFVHRLKHNNRNTEAYMRSGNLPVRYEVINEGPRSKLSSQITSTQNTIPIEDSSLYPNTGSIYLDNEIINYTGKSGNNLIGASRSASFSNFAASASRTYSAGPAASHPKSTGAILISNTATPIISHWGSAFITDGLFDADRGYIFNYQYVGGTLTTTKSTLFMIRLAPSVSNAITGDLGQRELINRAQMLLKSLEFTPTSGSSSQAVIIEGVLNPSNYPTDPTEVNWFGLSSQGAGGQPSFAQLTNASNLTWSGGAATVTATNTIFRNYFTQYQIFDKVETATVRIGFFVTGSGVPGGTRVVNIFNYDTNNQYIQFSNSVNSGPSGNSYTFTANTVSAAPGETVFSFVSSGASGGSLDLSDLKELNNTPIGGRGTFPNGPDVLAINAYLSTGTCGANFVLRWSEAQA